ncbi:MAG: hypothetical protein JWR40_221 [Massilia sp.]|jgi:hypothetical protein|nr:hypothetical protein [Massilia sp.]MDB5950216.1 hypothetical protein [Massilia sp.]
MAEATEEYRGYRIVVTPVLDCNDLWDFEYRLKRIDGSGDERIRAKSAGGYATPETACVAGIEVARTEADNLLALDTARQG